MLFHKQYSVAPATALWGSAVTGCNIALHCIGHFEKSRDDLKVSRRMCVAFYARNLSIHIVCDEKGSLHCTTRGLGKQALQARTFLLAGCLGLLT